MSENEKRLKNNYEQQLQNLETVKSQKIESLEVKLNSVESEKSVLLKFIKSKGTNEHKQTNREVEQKLLDQDQQISSLNRQIQEWMHSYGILNDECLQHKTDLNNNIKVKFHLSFIS